MMNKQSSRKLTVDWTKEIHSKGTSFSKFRQKGHDELHYHPGYVQVEKPVETYATGSAYEGHHNALGFAGLGTYRYPHGAIYQGYFKDGQFHGDGTITYPKGQQLDGTWFYGILLNYTFRFADGLEYHHPWSYLKQPDRTFQIETNLGLQPPKNEFLTNEQTKRTIPEHCYDTGDGYYRPENKAIYSGRHKVVRICRPNEEEVIEHHFRQIADNPIGFRPDLYEYWTSGRRREIANITKRMKKSSSKGRLYSPSLTKFEEEEFKFEE